MSDFAIQALGAAIGFFLPPLVILVSYLFKRPTRQANDAADAAYRLTGRYVSHEDNEL